MTAHAISAIQNQTTEILSEVIGRNSNVALLDFPAHANAGDLLIFQGELDYLADLGCSVGYMSSVHTHSAEVMNRRVAEGPIVLHGGGNFGDRYPIFQEFREAVISAHPDRRIIQSPQTFDYTDERNLIRTQQIYARHPNLTLLIRDAASVERVAELFPHNRVLYCPDAALGAGAIEPVGAADHEVALLKRIDGESLHSADDIPPRLLGMSHMSDWNHGLFDSNIGWWPRTFAVQALNMIGPLQKAVYPATSRAFENHMNVVVDGAVRLLSRGRVVVTDRLHAAILGMLMGKPVIAIDNVNGKLSAAYRDFLGDASNVRFAGSFHEALDVVGEF